MSMTLNDAETSHSWKRRRSGKLGRDWNCDHASCEKDFKSKKALTAHHKVIHHGQRNHVYPRPLCDGIRIQTPSTTAPRKNAFLRACMSSSSSAEETTNAEASEATVGLDVIEITGRAYARRLQNAGFICCLLPDVNELHLLPS